MSTKLSFDTIEIKPSELSRYQALLDFLRFIIVSTSYIVQVNNLPGQGQSFVSLCILCILNRKKKSKSHWKWKWFGNLKILKIGKYDDTATMSKNLQTGHAHISGLDNYAQLCVRIIEYDNRSKNCERVWEYQKVIKIHRLDSVNIQPTIFRNMQTNNTTMLTKYYYDGLWVLSL